MCADDWLDEQLDEPDPDEEPDPLDGPHRWVRGTWRPVEDVPAIDQYQPNA